MRPEYSHWMGANVTACTCICKINYIPTSLHVQTRNKQKKNAFGRQVTVRAISKLPTGNSAASAICDYAWVLEVFERARSGLCAIHLLCNRCASTVATIPCRAYKHLLAYFLVAVYDAHRSRNSGWMDGSTRWLWECSDEWNLCRGPALNANVKWLIRHTLLKKERKDDRESVPKCDTLQTEAGYLVTTRLCVVPA